MSRLVSALRAAPTLASAFRATADWAREEPLSIVIQSSQEHPKGLILEIAISGSVDDRDSVDSMIEFVKRVMQEVNPPAVAFHVLECNGHYRGKLLSSVVVMGALGSKRPCVIVGTSAAARETVGWLNRERVKDGCWFGPFRYFRKLEDGISDLKARLEAGTA